MKVVTTGTAARRCSELLHELPERSEYLEPAGDGVPGNPFDPGNRGNADTLNSESDDPVLCQNSALLK